MGIIETTLVLVVIIALVWVAYMAMQAEVEQTCYLCGKYFKPSVHTPLPTRKWPYHFCCDLHKDDYIRSRE